MSHRGRAARAQFVVIGSAHWHAAGHLRALRSAGASVVGVWDPAPAASEALLATGADLPDETTIFDDWRVMLKAFPAASVLVLSRPADTPAVLLDVIAMGRDFAVEKPGTVNADALGPVIGAVATAGVRAAVPLINRYGAFWRELAEIEPGNAVPSSWTHAHFRILAGPPSRYVSDGVPWVLDPEVYGGGALRNLGVHATDAILTITSLDELIVDTAVVSNALYGLAVEDFAAATLHTSSGQTITLEAGYAMPSEGSADKSWRVHGQGWAVSETNGTVDVRSSDGVRSYVAPSASDHYLSFGRAFARIGAGEPQIAQLDDLRAAQTLVDRLYAAAS